MSVTSLENTPPAVPATPATPPPADPDVSDVSGVVDVPGRGRVAPVGAVIEERREKQAARAEAERLRQENEALRRKAENFDTVSPYLHLLTTHPEITGKRQQAPPQAQDPELIAAAEALGFYNDDNTPDTARAAKASAFFQKLAKGTVQEEIKPVAQTAHLTQAQALRQRAYEVVDKRGRPFAAREHIDRVLDSLPVDSQADINIVNTALMVARSMSLDGAPGEPLHTEGPGGGRPGGAPALTNLERAAARARGLSDDQWIKSRDSKDDSNLLE